MKPLPALTAFILGLAFAPAKVETVVKEVPGETVTVTKEITVPGPERIVTAEAPVSVPAAACADGSCEVQATEPEYYVPQRRGLFRWRR